MSFPQTIQFLNDNLQGTGDEDLLDHIKIGSGDALRVLFDRYHRLVFHVAFRIVRDSGEAEEVVQTVFLNIFHAAANFDRRKGTVRVWLLQYAYHRALHRKRHLAANRFYHWDELEAAVERGAARALWADTQESKRLISQLLLQLNPRQRAVLELTYYEGLTAIEIASRLQESVHVVRHELSRSLRALRLNTLTRPAAGKGEA